jgi:hypothetical protein
LIDEEHDKRAKEGEVLILPWAKVFTFSKKVDFKGKHFNPDWIAHKQDKIEMNYQIK